MTLRLPDDWVWDTWFATEGDTVHAFFLHAPRALGDPDRRHHHARIGHATSTDLRTWTPATFRLEPGGAGAFDELATWTGSVIPDGDGWLLAYTGLSVADRHRQQRIGFARSEDLATWRRTGPVLEADPRWYEVAPEGPETHWRDPWLWRAPDGSLHLLITARANHGPADGRGVIGHARSTDGGASFEVGPPLSVPGELRQLEVPQLVQAGPGRWLVLASCRSTDHAAVRRSRPGFVADTGTVALEGSSPLGPFVVPPGPFLLGGPADTRYAARLVEHRGRRWLLAWTDTVDGAFVGELADPIEVDLGRDGRLSIVPEAIA